MTLNGNNDLSKQINANEAWKNTHMLSALSDAGLRGMQHPAPVLVLAPETNLRIKPETLSLRIDGQDKPVAMADTHEYMATPASDPPPKSDNFGLEDDQVERGVYSYYGGKFSSIYAQLEFGKEYEFNFEIEAANPIYMINFLFPYRYVDLEELSATSVDGNGLMVMPMYARAKPMKSSTLTPQF
jgi:hypothetical protein